MQTRKVWPAKYLLGKYLFSCFFFINLFRKNLFDGTFEYRICYVGYLNDGKWSILLVYASQITSGDFVSETALLNEESFILNLSSWNFNLEKERRWKDDGGFFIWKWEAARVWKITSSWSWRGNWRQR